MKVLQYLQKIFVLFSRFIYLQILLVPHSSSFKTEKTEDECDLNILPESMSLLIAIVYCMSPSMLNVALQVINLSFAYLWTGTFLVSSFDEI